MKRSYFAACLLVGSVIGYPVVSVLSNATGIENQVAAIFLRATIFSFGAALLLGRKEVYSRLPVGLFVIFWTAYLLRLGYSFGLTNETASQPASTFFIWAIGVCMIPSGAVLLYKGEINFAKVGWIISLLGGVAMVGILLLGDTAIETDQGFVGDQNRWNLSTINPITVGHLGASLILAASAAFLYKKLTISKVVFYTGIALTGVVGLSLANSRGPVAALVVAIIFYGIAQIRGRRGYRFIMLLFLAGLILLYRYTDAIFGTDALLGRFASLLTGEDASALIRNQLYADGFFQFVSSPLIGDGVEVRSQAFYPHNVILEAFITTGILGGTAFLVFTLLSLRAAFLIMKFEPQKAVLALLAVQFIVAAQLSGAIYQAGAMWVLMSAVLSFSTVSKGLRFKPSKGQSLGVSNGLRSPVMLGTPISANRSR